MYRSKSQTWSPALLFATALAAGALLNHFLNQSGQNQSRPSRVSRAQPPLPSARLGAREEQVDHAMQQPSRRAFDQGVASPTGAAYDLDPRSISPG